VAATALALLAAPISVLAGALSLFTYFTSRGPRMAHVERSMASSLQALEGRLGAAERIVASGEAAILSAADDAKEYLARAESSRKRAASTLGALDARAAGSVNDKSTEVPFEQLPRAEQLRQVQASFVGRS